MFLLGLDAAGPLFAVDVDAPAPGGERPPRLIAAGLPRGSGAERPAPADGPRPVGLREAAAVLPQEEGGLVAYVAALLNWHRRHGFCARAARARSLGEGGLCGICPRCGTSHHPRTDPVVIMLVVDGADRVLLGRAPSWPPRRYSALAGFVEPGERLEEAVAREVAEESGVEVGPPRYVASQPWPFPTSLMLGFDAPVDRRRGAPAGGRDPGRALVRPRRGRGRRGRRHRRLGRDPGPGGPGRDLAAAAAAPRHRAAADRALARYLSAASKNPASRRS